MRFIAERGVPRGKEFRGNQLAKMGSRAQLRAPRPNAVRDESSIDQLATRARLHVLLSEELLSVYSMGGEKWRSRLADGSPMLGDLDEPGA